MNYKPLRKTKTKNNPIMDAIISLAKVVSNEQAPGRAEAASALAELMLAANTTPGVVDWMSLDVLEISECRIIENYIETLKKEITNVKGREEAYGTERAAQEIRWREEVIESLQLRMQNPEKWL